VALAALAIVDMCMYVAVLVYAFVNIIWFLILHRKYKIVHLTVFYTLTVVIATCRILYFLTVNSDISASDTSEWKC